jgi:hypothetical protein
MTRKMLALTLLFAIASFAAPAQAGYLCEDEDGELEICLRGMPYTSVIPGALPAEVPEKVSDVVVVAPRATVIDPKVVEVPVTVALPDMERLCSAYVPSLGEMLQLPCRD